MAEPAKPKGCLVAIGGNEDKSSDKEVLRQVLKLPDGGARHVEVIPTASRIPSDVARDYIRAFEDLGVRNVGVIDIRERRDADREEYVKRVHDADIVYMSGGDQMRLTTVLGGSEVAKALRETYLKGGVVAGTSAGAAAMSSTMIAGGDNEAAMRKGSILMSPGLGLVQDCVIDTHFLDRGRVGRLLEVVSSNPGHTGLGVGEDTGILIRQGEMVEVIGTGVVVVVDGHELKSTNLSRISLKEPIAVERLVLHTLVAGYRYHLRTQEYRAPSVEAKAR